MPAAESATLIDVGEFCVPVAVTGPVNGSVVVVVLGAAHRAPAAYDGICARLHTAGLRTVVIGFDPRLRAEAVSAILDRVGVRWGVLVGDRDGADVAWRLAATRLDRFTGLVAIDRGHPRVPDRGGRVRDDTCPPVEVATTMLTSSPASRSVAAASQRHVYGDYRQVDLLVGRPAAEATAQLAGEIVLRSSNW